MQLPPINKLKNGSPWDPLTGLELLIGQFKKGEGLKLGCFYHDSWEQKHTRIYSKIYMLVALSMDVFPVRKI